MKSDKVRGEFIKGIVFVEDDFNSALKLYNRSCFGEVKEKHIELSLFEAMYLLEKDKLAVLYNGKILNQSKFTKLASSSMNAFWVKYQVFKDLRTRGYILKTALKFGADFRVYSKGTRPGDKHAKWLLYCAGENDKMTWQQFSAMNRVAHSTKKSLLVGIVDSEGQVTYYEIKWKRP